VPSAWKLFFTTPMKHKPHRLIAVSAGPGASRALLQLRRTWRDFQSPPAVHH